MNFAINMKNLRKLRNLSQTDLADKLNVSQRTISHYEKGDSEPSLLIVCRMARIFNVTADELLGFTETDLSKYK